jgi:hypothetical protein
LIAQSRKAAIKQMQSKANEFTDLDLAIKTVRALVITNEENWNRCKGYYDKDDSFKMDIFDEVKVWNASDDEMTTIYAAADTTYKSFDVEALRTLPKCLQIFKPKKDESGLIDFRSFFTCLVLSFFDFSRN